MYWSKSWGDIGIVALGFFIYFIFMVPRFWVKVDVSVCRFEETAVDNACWFRMIETSKKFINWNSFNRLWFFEVYD